MFSVKSLVTRATSSNNQSKSRRARPRAACQAPVPTRPNFKIHQPEQELLGFDKICRFHRLNPEEINEVKAFLISIAEKVRDKKPLGTDLEVNKTKLNISDASVDPEYAEFLYETTIKHPSIPGAMVKVFQGENSTSITAGAYNDGGSQWHTVKCIRL